MSLLVKKFGGTSVGTTERIKIVARKIIKDVKLGHQVICVVSAMGKFTDDLITYSNEITDSPSDREMDMLLSTGEQISISLLAMAIKEMGYDAISLTGPQAEIVTDTVHKNAKIIDIKGARLKKELEAGKVIIVAGFQGLSVDGEITTLGRGGSDTTAVALCAAVNGDLCEIYTDVDGVYTTDPRITSDAKKLSSISYDEMLELASLGALVLQPRSVEFAKQYKVKMEVKSSFNDVEGTIVQEESDMENAQLVSGVAIDKNVGKITILGVPDLPGIAGKMFRKLSDSNINVDMIVQNNPRGLKNDISFTVTHEISVEAMELMEDLKEELKAEGVNYRDNLAKVSIVGAGMQSNAGVAASMFEALYENDINIELISTSEIKVSCLVRLDQGEEAVRAIHEKFNLHS